MAASHFARLLLVVLTVAASTGALASSPAFAVSSSPIAQSEQNPQLVEKIWTVAAEVHKLDIQIAGNVEVELDESLDVAAAKVIVRSSSPELLELVAVNGIESDDSEDGVRLHYKNKDSHLVAEVDARIIVGRSNLVDAVRAAYAQNVVLDANVLVNEDDSRELHLASVGATSIYVDDKISGSAFKLDSLTVHVEGDGVVQFRASTITVANKLSASVTGKGRVAILADAIVADQTLSTIAGDGDVFIQSNALDTEALHTSIVGGGNAIYSHSGSCKSQKISLAGSGTAFTGSIACEDADVSIVGDGRALVRVSNSLKTSTILSGSVKYVGARPQHIVSSGIVVMSKGFSTVAPAESNRFPVYTPHMAPRTTLTTVNLVIEAASNVDFPHIRVLPFTDSAITFQAVSSLLSPGVGALLLFEFAVVVLAFTAFSIFRHRQRRVREEYTPLV